MASLEGHACDFFREKMPGIRLGCVVLLDCAWSPRRCCGFRLGSDVRHRGIHRRGCGILPRHHTALHHILQSRDWDYRGSLAVAYLCDAEDARFAGDFFHDEEVISLAVAQHDTFAVHRPDLSRNRRE